MWIRAFDAGLEFDESAVVGDADHAADGARSLWVAFADGFPGIGNQLLQSEGNSFLFLIELEHFDGNLVAGIHHFGRMVDAAVRHIADVQQAIDAAEVNECAVFGKVLDHSGYYAALFEHLQRSALARELFFFHRHFPRHDNIAAAAIELNDLDRDVLTEEAVEVVNGAKIDLGTGHERGDAHIHRETAFDASGDMAGDDERVTMGLFESIPAAEPAGLFVREENVTFRLHSLPIHHHVDHVAGLDCYAAIGLAELLDWYEPFRFISEVDDDIGIVEFYDAALQQFAFVRRSEMTVVLNELLVVRFFRGHGQF